MAQRFIEESESGLAIMVQIVGVLLYILLVIPFMLVVDLILNARRRRARVAQPPRDKPQAFWSDRA